MFYLVRHGKTDYSERNTKIYQGFGVNLSKLSEKGVRQVKETALDDRLKGTDLILSSPYTRALQTAAILSKELGAELVVETDLHEWLANKNYVYEEEETAEKAYEEYMERAGEYPGGEERPWESAADMRKRVLGVLRKYADYEKVVVACHGMMIQAVTGEMGEPYPKCGGIVEFNYDAAEGR